MVLYRRVNERLLTDARKEGHQAGQETTQRRWREWYDSLPQEVREQTPPPEEER